MPGKKRTHSTKPSLGWCLSDCFHNKLLSCYYRLPKSRQKKVKNVNSIQKIYIWAMTSFWFVDPVQIIIINFKNFSAEHNYLLAFGPFSVFPFIDFTIFRFPVDISQRHNTDVSIETNKKIVTSVITKGSQYYASTSIVWQLLYFTPKSFYYLQISLTSQRK